jgi:hypothetical protein
MKRSIFEPQSKVSLERGLKTCYPQLNISGPSTFQSTFQTFQVRSKIEKESPIPKTQPSDQFQARNLTFMLESANSKRSL